VPFFILGALSGLATIWLERHQVGAKGPDWELSLVQRSLLAGRVIVFYLGKLVWPTGLTFIYPRWTIDVGAWTSYIPSLAVVGSLGALWAFRRRVGSEPLAAACIFVITLGPALGFVDAYPFKYSYVADHFQYLAGAAILSLVCPLVERIRRRRRSRRAYALFMTLLAAVVLGLATLTYRRAQAFQDEETLWRDTLAKNPGAIIAYNNLGILYAERGDDARAREVFREGLAHAPDDVDLMTNLGGVLVRLGEIEEATKLLREAAAREPRNPWSLTNLGLAFLRQGKAETAIDLFEAAIRLRPEMIEAHKGLATALAEMGRTDEAIRAVERGLQAGPDHPVLLNDLQVLRRRAGAAPVR
jgi:tetratricopeptide (TPR) repeat protein